MKKWVLINLFACLLTFASFTTVAMDEAVDDNVEDTKPRLHVYDDVDLISAIKYQQPTARSNIKTVYPQLESDSDNPSVRKFNQLIKALVEEQINYFIHEVKSIKNPPELNKSAKNELYIDYDAVSLNPDNNQLISTRFVIQGYIIGMAHPYHQYAVLNYNLDRGEKIELADLFKADSNYLTILSDYAQQVLLKRFKKNNNKDMIESGITPTETHFKNWNIKPNGIMFTFDEGSVAPYVNGPQTVLIPYTALKNIISPHSPLARCVKHQRFCRRNNLLTGGFIDSLDV